MFVNKNIDINIVSYPISMAISIVPNIVDIDIDISLTPASVYQVLLFLEGGEGEQESSDLDKTF